MTLKDIQQKARQRGLDFEFKFGKWKGWTVKAVIDETHGGFIRWLMDNRNFQLDNEAFRYLEYVEEDTLPF